MQIIEKEITGFGTFGSFWSDLGRDENGREIVQDNE
jgi:hypothetical protein